MKRILIIVMAVVLFNVGGNLENGNYVSAASKPSPSSVTSMTSGSNMKEGEITLKWKKVSCKGYEIQYATTSSFSGSSSINVSNSSTVNRELTGLAKGKKYYARVRSYNTSGSKKLYSSWSSSKSCTVHEHVFKSYVIDQPGCEKTGEQLYTCDGCGYTYREELASFAHRYVRNVVKKPTASTAGKAQYKCKRCGKTYTESIAKLSAKSTTKATSKASTKQTTKSTSKTAKQKQTSKPLSAATKATTRASNMNIPTAAATRGTTSEVNTTATTQVVTKATTKATEKKLTKEERTEKARESAVKWAIDIANNNEFHYGKSKWAHKSGCYFCGTNQKASSGKRKAGASLAECAKTYCCNPFVTAAYRHGAGTKELNCKYKNKRVNLANDKNKALSNKKAFKRISKPKKVTSLKTGDILLTPTHAMLYAGDGKVVHAAHHDNGKKDAYWDSSIVYAKISDKQWKRTSKIYRYIGTGRY